MRHLHSKPWLITELLLLMVVLPALLYWMLPLKYLLPIIWGAALYGYTITRLTIPESIRNWWERSALRWEHIRPILLRFAVCASILGLATAVLRPDLLFNFPRERTAFWLMVMVLYPLLSVIPQEIIFRSFFFDRYGPLFKHPSAIILVSGIAFGSAHLLFHNWVAPLLCLVGGIMFAGTYAKHRSLWLVVLEHALYGDFLFTIGLGRYFYHGTVAMAAQ